jgi:uncharacterized protein YkwD
MLFIGVRPIRHCMGTVRAWTAVLVLVAALAAVPLVSAAQRPTGLRPTARAAITLEPRLDDAIVARLNAVRLSYGLGRVVLNTHLAAAAAMHSRELAAAGVFEHASPDGTAFWKRIERYYPATGFRAWDVGETLLWWSPGTTAATTVADWLASPHHRAILLTPSWREIGVAAVHDPAAPGVYRGLEVTIVTADFGTRTR